MEVHGASEAIEIAEAMLACRSASGTSRNRTKEALASARDFPRRCSHELRTPLTAMHQPEVLSTLDLPGRPAQRSANDVIRTQSRIEATLSAGAGWPRANCRPGRSRAGRYHRRRFDRAAHDVRPGSTPISMYRWCRRRPASSWGLPAGLRLPSHNAIANAVATAAPPWFNSPRSARGPREIAIDDNGSGGPEGGRHGAIERFSRGSTASHSGSGPGWWAQQAQLHGGTGALSENSLPGGALCCAFLGPVSPAALTSCPPLCATA